MGGLSFKSCNLTDKSFLLQNVHGSKVIVSNFDFVLLEFNILGTMRTSLAFKFFSRFFLKGDVEVTHLCFHNTISEVSMVTRSPCQYLTIHETVLWH